MDINLIDWRQQHKMIANNRFYVVIGVIVVACAIATASSNFVLMIYMHQSKKNVKLLDKELTELEGKIQKIKNIEEQKASLLTRRSTIQKLQKGRVFLVQVWEDLAKVLPDGIILDEIHSSGDQIQLVGSGANNEEIAALLNNIQQLAWVQDAKVNELKAKVTTETSNPDDINRIDFSLLISVKPDQGMNVKDEKASGN